MERYFREREDEFEREYYATLLPNVRGILERHGQRLREFDFIILKPDAVVRGLVGKIIGMLKSEGIEAVAARPFLFSEGIKEDLYRFVKRKYFNTWWVYGAYSLAPSMAILLMGPSNGHEHLPARVRAMVGPTTPWVGDGIRYNLSGSNRLFNLIHASDDPAAALREALIFFSPDEIGEILDGGGPVQVKDLVTEPMELDWPSVCSRVLDAARSYLNGVGLDASGLESLAEEVRSLSGRKPGDFLEGLSSISRTAHSVVSNLREEARGRLLEEMRSSLGSQRAGRAASLAAAADVLALIDLLFDFEELAKSGSEPKLHVLYDTLDLDPWDAAIVHTTQATMPQVLRDLKKYGVEYPKG